MYISACFLERTHRGVAEVTQLHHIVKRIEDRRRLLQTWLKILNKAVMNYTTHQIQFKVQFQVLKDSSEKPTLRQHQEVTTDITEDAAVTATSLPTVPHGLFNNAVSDGTA